MTNFSVRREPKLTDARFKSGTFQLWEDEAEEELHGIQEFPPYYSFGQF